MDKDFFVQELEAHGGMLYRVAYTILHDDDACRDALQDAALKAWEKRRSLRETRYFRTWITRILINTCYDTVKKRRRIVSLEEIREQASPPPDLTLSLALASLPEKLRLPLVLCYSEGMSYQEAADALHVPMATVRGRIHRAKGALKKELDENPDRKELDAE
ncbi:MAG: RNA polymerase sigma factor [Clostridia bacterium]|nr:RNA polymerase sigma factor [Clostridia bacterium]